MRFDQGCQVRLKQFESRGDIGVIGDRIIKDRITVLAVSYFISLALAWARAFVANANRTRRPSIIPASTNQEVIFPVALSLGFTTRLKRLWRGIGWILL